MKCESEDGSQRILHLPRWFAKYHCLENVVHFAGSSRGPDAFTRIIPSEQATRIYRRAVAHRPEHGHNGLGDTIVDGRTCAPALTVSIFAEVERKLPATRCCIRCTRDALLKSLRDERTCRCRSQTRSTVFSMCSRACCCINGDCCSMKDPSGYILQCE